MSPPGDAITSPPESNKARRRRIAAERASGVTAASKAGVDPNKPKAQKPQQKPQPKLQDLNNGAPQPKAKPKVGRGEYVSAPRTRDKVKSVRWQANALVNNPAVAGTIIAGGAAAGAQANKKNWSKKVRTALTWPLVPLLVVPLESWVGRRTAITTSARRLLLVRPGAPTVTSGPTSLAHTRRSSLSSSANRPDTPRTKPSLELSRARG